MNFTVTVLQGIHAERQHVYLKTNLFFFFKIPLHDKIPEIVSEYEPCRIRFSKFKSAAILYQKPHSELLFVFPPKCQRKSPVPNKLDFISWLHQIQYANYASMWYRNSSEIFIVSIFKPSTVSYRLKGLTQWGHKIMPNSTRWPCGRCDDNHSNLDMPSKYKTIL